MWSSKGSSFVAFGFFQLKHFEILLTRMPSFCFSIWVIWFLVMLKLFKFCKKFPRDITRVNVIFLYIIFYRIWSISYHKPSDANVHHLLQKKIFGTFFKFLSSVEPEIIKRSAIYNFSFLVCNIIKTVYIQRFDECRWGRSYWRRISAGELLTIPPSKVISFINIWEYFN